MPKQIEELSLYDILPDSIAENEEVTNVVKASDLEFQLVSQAIRECLILSRIDELPENIIDLLAWQYHVDNYEPLSLPLAQKRNLVRNTIEMHRHKGTIYGVRQEFLNVGYVRCDVLEWWQSVPQGEPYTFSLLLSPYDETKAEIVRHKILSAKNVRSWLNDLRFRLVLEDVFGEDEFCELFKIKIANDFCEIQGENEHIHTQANAVLDERIWTSYLYKPPNSPDIYYDYAHTYGGQESENNETLFLKGDKQFAFTDANDEVENVCHTFKIVI